MSFYSQFAPYYRAIFPLDEQAHAFLEACLPSAARSVLDIGCGTGDHCGRFAEGGLRAAGIDLDPEMVAEAKARYPRADFALLDAMDVAALARRFDLAFSVGNVLSHIEKAALPRLVEGLKAVVPTGGTWVFQVVNWDFILERERYRFPDIVLEGGRIVFEREYPAVSDDSVRFVTRLLSAGREIFSGEVTLHPARSDEYADVHRRHGFDLVAHYADFRGRAFDPASESSSVFVLRRF